LTHKDRSGYVKFIDITRSTAMQIFHVYLSCLLVSCLAVTTSTIPAFTQIGYTEQFTATSNCPALRSIRKGTNPGNVMLTPDRTYRVVGKNRERPSHYLLDINGTAPARRWVAKECGNLSSATLKPKPTRSNPERPQAYVLAVNWQPSFCETKPRKTECLTQTAERFDATNFTLHGLWPENGEYCGVSTKIRNLDLNNRWNELPPIDLSPQTAKDLARKMPGFASNLQLHEWYKHGSCYGTSPDRYFQDAMRLQDLINSSKVRDLFANNIDKTISDREIRTSFDLAFGAGAGSKVTIGCSLDTDPTRRKLMSELQINLSGKIEENTSISTLITAAKNTRKNSCRRGEVDRAGAN
jgi:ribonuclease T2